MEDLLQKESIFIRQQEILSYVNYLCKIDKALKELKFRIDLGVKAK